MTTVTVPLPTPTADRLRALIAQRETVEAMIRTLTDTAGECLGVPPGSQLQVQADGNIAFVAQGDGDNST